MLCFISVNHSHICPSSCVWPMGCRGGRAQSGGRSQCRWPREAQLHEGSRRSCIRVLPPRFPLRAPLTEHPREEARDGTAGPRRSGEEPGQERTPESGLMLAARPPFKRGCCCCNHKGSPFIREAIGRVNVPRFHTQSRSVDANRTNGPWQAGQHPSLPAAFQRLTGPESWATRRPPNGATRWKAVGVFNAPQSFCLVIIIIIIDPQMLIGIWSCMREASAPERMLMLSMAITGSNNVLML